MINFGGMYRKGGVLYYTICAHVPETQKCVTFVTFVTLWHKYQHVTALFVTLWHKCQHVTVCNARIARCFDKYATWDNCKYATPLYFYRVNCIFFGYRAFYPFFIQILAVILHRNSKSSHVHRTFIALPSHTRTWVAAMRSSSSAKEQARSLRRSKHKQDFSRLNKIFYSTTRNNFGNFEKFCSI